MTLEESRPGVCEVVDEVVVEETPDSMGGVLIKAISL
jgi:hypothetical protein